MGQNMVGWTTLRVIGPSGATVKLRFAERLLPDGSIYTENLRNAEATDVYTLRGGGPETFTPHFTFHGFRYVEVSGLPGLSLIHILSKPFRAQFLLHRFWDRLQKIALQALRHQQSIFFREVRIRGLQ